MAKIVREHGGIKEYRRGCRCEPCKEANREYMTEYRERHRKEADRLAAYEEGDTRWVKRAKCRGEDTSIFFPERGDNSLIAQAKAFCLECEVVENCLAYAIRTEQPVGVWGNKSTRERSHILHLMKKG